MIDGIIEMILQIWRADSNMREGSVVGESRMDRSSRHYVALICGSLIAVISVIGCVIWWLID
jgi:hypothetical protein